MHSVNDLIRNSIEEGRFGGLTLFICSAGYQANLKLKPGGGWRTAVHEDPIQALRLVLDRKTPAAPVAEQGSVFD